MRKLSFLIFTVILFAYVPAYSLISEGSDAPDFTLTDVNGVSHTLSDYAGKVVLIEYFSLSCDPCHKISDFLENLYQTNKDKGFIVLAVDVEEVDDNTMGVQQYAELYGWTFPAFWDQLGVVKNLYGYEEKPSSIIIGKDQKVDKAVTRVHLQSEYQTWIDEALNQGQQPRIIVSTNQIQYTMNQDRMKVYLEVQNPGSLITVDVAFAINHRSTGSVEMKTWFAPSWSDRYTSFRVVLEAGMLSTKILMVDCPVPCFMIDQPPITETGEYIWAAALINPETMKPISEISTTTVEVVDPKPMEPVVTVSTDQISYNMNRDRMKVFLEVQNPGGLVVADLVFALYHAPTGNPELGRLWFYPNWSTDFQSFRMTLDAGFVLTKTRIIDIALPATGLGAPPITESGEFTWGAAFLKPDSLDPISRVSTATVQVFDDQVPSLFPSQRMDPTIKISTDARDYTMGEDTMGVFLEATNPGPDVLVDIIFALYHEPEGGLMGKLWFFPNWTEDYRFLPITLPSQFVLNKIKIMDVPVPSLMPGSPPITEAGFYTWAAALAEHGTLNFYGGAAGISTATVQVKGSTMPTK
jgi:peroxiredoxin